MLTELLKEENLKAYLAYFQKDEKKFKKVRYIFAGFFFLIYLMIVLITGNNMLFAGLPVAFLVGYKAPYLDVLLKKKESDLVNSYLFPEFLQTFMALQSSSGNVYQTLNAALPYTKDPLKSKLEVLVRSIETRSERKYYLDFAEYIGSTEAYMIMDMIYQFSEYGMRKEAVRELDDYIRNLQENKTDELILKKMNGMDSLAAIPIFVSLFLVGGFAVVIFLHFMQPLTGALDIIS